MNKISAIIVVKDNPLYLEKTLSSIEGFVSEIIVADIGMHYQVNNLLNNYKHINVIKIDVPVPYVEIIREELKQKAKEEYVLFIDPDEVLTDELKDKLIKNLNDYDYFSIPRKNIIFNKWIKNSRWWPDYQVRLFKKDKVIWPTQIHKQPTCEGKNMIVEPEENLAIVHYNYNNLDEYIEKARRYAKAEASDLSSDGKELILGETIKKSLSEFISRYFANKGYEDGMHGFVLSFLQMFYYFLVYFYYWEQKKYFEVKEEEIINSANKFFKQGLYETNYWTDKKNPQQGVSKIKGKIQNVLVRKLLK